METLLWDEIAMLSIRFTPVIGRNHIDDFLPIIDFIKESPRTDTVAPGRRFPILQSLNIGAEMWVGSELGVGIGLKLFLNPSQTSSTKFGKIFFERGRFEDLILT